MLTLGSAADGWGVWVFLGSMSAVVGGLGLLMAGGPARYFMRRATGQHALAVGPEGIAGAVVPVRGGRLDWRDVREVALHESGPAPVVALAVGPAVARSLDVRLVNLMPGSNARFEHEAVLPPTDRDGASVLDAVRAGHRRWGRASGEAPMTPRAQTHQVRLAAVAQGEAVTLTPRRGRVLALVLLVFPILAAVTVGLAAAPVALVLSEGVDGENGVLVLILAVVAVVVCPLLIHLLVWVGRRALGHLRGMALWELGSDGLVDPSGLVFRRPVPWPACLFASVYRQPRGGEHTVLYVEPLADYLAHAGAVGRLVQTLNGTMFGGAVGVSGQEAGLSADEMAELLNAARRHWGGHPV